MPPTDPLTTLTALLGPAGVLIDPADLAPYLTERRGLYQGRTRAVLRPSTVEQVSAVMAFATQHRLAVVPQGGNTGLVGGQIPDESGDQLVLSLARLNRLREADPATDTLTVEAGMTLAEAQAAALSIGRLFPLSLASEGSCTIGGVLSTNAGGTAVLAYGNARDLALGLEVVLADGRVLNGLSKLRKDNTGYDLTRLFIGSEGTLGIITAATLKLFPRPRAVATAFCGLDGPKAALDLLGRCKESFGAALTSFELLPRFGLDLVLKHAPGSRDPLADPHAWYVLIEVSSARPESVGDEVEAVLAEALEAGVIADAALARSEADRNAFWSLRETMSEVQSREGGSIKHDVSVPVGRVPDLIRDGIARAEAFMPGIRPLPFGHVGDGNIHFNFSQPVGMDKAAFLARWGELNTLIHDLVADLGGSFSAEHGIGRLKRGELARRKDPVALDVMRALKATLDPDGILNPGKML